MNPNKTVIVSGHRVEEIQDVSVLSDTGECLHVGTIYGVNRPVFKGTMTIKLGPDSSSLRWFVQRLQEANEAIRAGQPHRIYDGYYVDHEVPLELRLQEGSLDLEQSSSRVVPRASFTVVLNFGEIRVVGDGHAESLSLR